MSTDLDPTVLDELDGAIRRAVAELEAALRQRRLAAERACVWWRGGRRRAFDEVSAQLDVVTRRLLGELAALRKAVLATGGAR